MLLIYLSNIFKQQTHVCLIISLCQKKVKRFSWVVFFFFFATLLCINTRSRGATVNQGFRFLPSTEGQGLFLEAMGI